VNYTLHVPPNVPAAAFWSFTVYDVSTRTLILNDTKQADRSSRMDLLTNADGSVDLYIGPKKPKGNKAKNWIQTMPGKAWFPYFRLYSPAQAFLDKSRSEEHTSELQSHLNLVCRLLLEKTKPKI